MAEPRIKIELANPTLDSLALLVELADHHGVDGRTDITTERRYVGSGEDRRNEEVVSFEVDAFLLHMPAIDHTADEEDWDVGVAL